MKSFENKKGKAVLMAMVSAIQENKAYLSEVDGLIGDGDHGVNMNKGFTLFQERYQDKDFDLSEGLEELGSVLFNEIGGSMGPIYGSILMEMADTCQGVDKIDLKLFSDMLQAGLNGLYDIVDARPGDKTLVDTLEPCVRSLQTSLEKGEDMDTALSAMESAAQAGRDSTKDMVAKFGRSSRLGERSRGVLDAGATSCCLILCAMSEAIRGLLIE